MRARSCVRPRDSAARQHAFNFCERWRGILYRAILQLTKHDNLSSDELEEENDHHAHFGAQWYNFHIDLVSESFRTL